MAFQPLQVFLQQLFESLEFGSFLKAVEIFGLKETNFVLKETFPIAESFILLFAMRDANAQVVGNRVELDF